MSAQTQNGVLKHDDNGYPVFGGTSSSDNATIVNASFDPATRRLLTNASSSGITVNTTTITGGTTTRVLYDNAGTVGETTGLTTDGTNVTIVMGTGTINKLTITQPATGSTLTIANGKTLTASVTMTLQGGDASVLSIAASKTLTASDTTTLATAAITLGNAKVLTLSDSTTLNTNAITLGGGEVITFSASNALSLLTSGSTVITFPQVTDTAAVLGTAQSYTAVSTNSTDYRLTPQAVTVSSNAGTCDITHGIQNFTNSSASAMTITLTTTSAVDGQKKIVRIFDASAVAKAITWVNTENSLVSAPSSSNGSTSIPTTVGFIYNSGTSKWTCVAAC